MLHGLAELSSVDDRDATRGGPGALEPAAVEFCAVHRATLTPMENDGGPVRATTPSTMMDGEASGAVGVTCGQSTVLPRQASLPDL